MQSHWSPVSDEAVPAPDGVGGPTPGTDGSPTDPTSVDHGVAGDSAPPAAGASVDGIVPTDPGVTDGGPGTPGDDEALHRSQVDAVDALLDEVELALTRLDDGTYGRCESCGAPIDDERLAELPIVRSCGRCDGSDGTPAPDTSDGDAAPAAPDTGAPAWA